MISPKDLSLLGLTKNTATIYLALQQRGQAKAASLISDTGLHRNIAYLALAHLEKSHLITSSVARGVTQFKALDPVNLLHQIRTQETAAHIIIEELRRTRKPQTQEIIVYEGLEELRRKELESFVLTPIESEICYIGISDHWHKAMGEKLKNQLVQIQQDRKIHIRAIGTHPTTEAADFLANKNLMEVKYLPGINSEISETQISIDRIMIKTFVEPYSVVEIINPLVAKSYKDFFETMWCTK